MESLWEGGCNQVQDLVSKPEKFLEPKKCEAHFEKAKLVTKVFYDAAKLLEEEVDPTTLPELVIHDFDAEQVWAGVELQNKANFERFVDEIEAVKRFHNLMFFCQPTVQDEVEKKEPIDSDEDDLNELTLNQDAFVEDETDDNEEEETEEREMNGVLDDPEFQHMSDSDLDDLPLFEKEETDDEVEEEDDDDNDDDEKENDQKEKVADGAAEKYMKNALESIRSAVGKKGINEKRNLRLEVEDQFFNLDQMERFLDAEDAKENRKRLREDKRDDSEDDLDLFAEDSLDDKEVRNMKYSDYFDDGGKGKAGEDSVSRKRITLENNEGVDRNKSRKEKGIPLEEDIDSFEDVSPDNGEAGNANQSSQFDDGDEKDLVSRKRVMLEDDESSDDLGEVKSSHEQRMLRLQKKVRRMEEEALKSTTNDGKLWQLKGEIAAVERPENSLLQEHLDYDMVSRQAPVITEAVSTTLEDIILRRIKDKAWDDVARKIKLVENPYEYKKKLVLDQEKSKLSLAQVYEHEYLRQKDALDEAKKTPGMLSSEPSDQIPKEVEGMQKSMRFLFTKLDALTHFHFTPRAKDAEVKVIRNAPTLAMEEVAPVAMSDANLLAPQEILDKTRGEDIGSAERTATDVSRDRRKKKARQSAVRKESEKRRKLVNKLNPGLGNKYSKERMLKDLEVAEKQGKLTTIKEDRTKGKSVKSSSAFFNQLQNEAQSVVKGVKKAAGKEPVGKLSGSRLKL